MKRLNVDRRQSRLRLQTKYPGSSFHELTLPSRDLVGMHVKLLGEFGQRLLALHGSQGHLRFESRAVVPAWSSAHCLSCSAAILAAIRQKLHSLHCAEIPSQLSAAAYIDLHCSYGPLWWL